MSHSVTNKKTDEIIQPSWGRNKGPSNLTVLGSACIMLFCPALVVVFWNCCDKYQCSFQKQLNTLLESPSNFKFFPNFNIDSFKLYIGWVIVQGLLYAFVPSKIGYGQTTPAGHTLPYKVNGLTNWIITHFFYILLSQVFNFFEPTIIYDNWEGILVATNIYGYLLTLFSYVKAHVFPSHSDDRKFSGSHIYDLFMGIELNPRIGQLWDFKLFHNGRPGILAWTLINYSFMCAQYKNEGYVTNSMLLLNLFHFMYVIDFFIHEDWYLRTIDIAHDHFGFYLAWGDSVWLPFMYTVQSNFLVRVPLNLSNEYLALNVFLGFLGYYIFRAVNNQKDLVRKTNGNCNIWGKPATFIRSEYTSSDGKKHTSILLTSGFWGLSRHFNYVGDLILSFAMCMTCGTNHLLPYFYIIYMTILLVHRIERDHERCKGKYGKYWDQYCGQVKYKLIPYVY